MWVFAEVSRLVGVSLLAGLVTLGHTAAHAAVGRNCPLRRCDLLMSDHCLAVLQTAFQTLWQCFEAHSLGISCAILAHAYIRNFLLGWRPIAGGQRLFCSSVRGGGPRSAALS